MEAPNDHGEAHPVPPVRRARGLAARGLRAAPPGPGEVLVRVRAAAANPMDWKIRSGAMKMLTG
ncbi:hypothetical protein ACFQ10_16100 [Streptomyces indonesiensis]